jgi:hypothetical protein
MRIPSAVADSSVLLRLHLLALALAGTSLAAQVPDDSAVRPPARRLCFQGRPEQFCRMFAVTEFGYARSFDSQAETPFGEPHIEPHVFMWELGLMRNTDSRTALGGTVLLTSRFSVGLKARYRRWLWRDVSLEVAPGLIVHDSRQFARTPAFTGHLLLNLEDVLSVGGMLEVSRFGADTDAGRPPSTITKPFLVARLGSYPGLVGVVATGTFIGVLALLIEGPTY